MPLHVPTSSQWITFPIEPKKKVLVSWSDETIQRQNTYYVTKCYWGNVAADKEPPITTPTEYRKGPIAHRKTKLKEVIGETIIYIAAEFIEPQYAGGQLERLHLKDLVARSYIGRKVLPGSLLNDQEVSDADNGEGNTGASKKETSDASNDKESEWITMQLNDFFHYGQNAAYKNGSDPQYRLSRWIVYHPRLSEKIPFPSMFQHRFTGAASLDVAQATLAQVTKYAPDEKKEIASAIKIGASFLLDVTRTNVGDSLHRFLSPHDVKYVKKEVTQNQKGGEIPNVELLALQFAEAKPPVEDPQQIKYKVQTAKEAIEKEGKFLKEFGKSWAAKKLRISDGDLDPESEDWDVKFLNEVALAQPDLDNGFFLA